MKRRAPSAEDGALRPERREPRDDEEAVSAERRDYVVNFLDLFSRRVEKSLGSAAGRLRAWREPRAENEKAGGERLAPRTAAKPRSSGPGVRERRQGQPLDPAQAELGAPSGAEGG